LNTKPYLTGIKAAMLGFLVAMPLQAQSLAGDLSNVVGFGAMGGIIVFLLAWTQALRWQLRRIGSSSSAVASAQEKREMVWDDEHEILQTLLEHASDQIYFKDRDSRFRWCCKAVCDRFGVKQEDMVGKSDFDFFDEAHARPAFEDEQEILRTGVAFHGKVEKEVFKDGRVHWALSSKMPLRNKAGEIVGTFGISKDITAIKEAEEKLRFSETRFRSIWEKSLEGMRLTDEKGTMLAVNPAFCQIVGLSAGELVGRPFTAIYADSEDADGMLRKYQQRFVDRKIEGQMERRVTLRSGKKADLELSNCFIEREGGQTEVLSMGRDVTARKQTEAELARERDLLRSLMEHAFDSIYFKDRQSRFLRCSKAMSLRFGVGTPDSLVGKTDFDFYEESHALEAFEDEQQIIRTGLPIRGKIEREVLKDGAQQWALTSKMPLRNKAGEIIGTFGVSKDVTFIKDAEAKLEKAHKQLVESSRVAGMAEVATTVLHNVGNVLNSVNVSASLVADRVKNSKSVNLARAAELLQEHAADLADFLSRDPKGSKLPSYFASLAESLATEQNEILTELSSLRSNIEHIKEIVAMQQAYAKVAGLQESLKATDLIEDALRLNAGAVERHQVQVIREFTDSPAILVDKHKVLQILVNLIRNAKYALEYVDPREKRMILRSEPGEKGSVKISVIDNGVGIAAENLNRIFEHGFTTRENGHGFALHSGALAARQMGGSLTGFSAGPGQGATFTLVLPAYPPEESP
jgi:PAS domain S-box-containing protein